VVIAEYVDFSIPGAALAALWAGFLFPVYLLLVVRLPVLANARGAQFALGTAIMCAVWVATLCFCHGDAYGIERMDLWLGLTILGTWFLLYLEMWSLLSRGYTLGMLVTIYTAGRPLTRDELAARYRSGDGLEWIMTHRLGGLVAARLVRRRGDQIELTVFPGLPVAAAYRAATRLIGLKKSG